MLIEFKKKKPTSLIEGSCAKWDLSPLLYINHQATSSMVRCKKKVPYVDKILLLKDLFVDKRADLHGGNNISKGRIQDVHLVI